MIILFWIAIAYLIIVLLWVGMAAIALFKSGKKKR